MRRFNLRRNVRDAVLAFGVNIGLVFISYRLLIAQGGLEAVGIWSTLMAWIYLVRLGDVGMSGATLHFVALRDPAVDRAMIRRYVDTAIMCNAALFLVLGLLGFAVLRNQIGHILPAVAQMRALAVLPVMFVGVFVMALSGPVLAALQGLHLGYVAARLGTAGAALQLLIVAALVPRLGLGGLAWGVVVQHLAVAVVGWGILHARVGGPLLPCRISAVRLREMLGFSLKAQAASLANGAFEPLAKIMLSRLAGLEAQGLFELAYKTVALPRNAVVAGVQATLPATTDLLQRNPAQAGHLYRRVLRRVTLAMAVVLAGTVALAPLASWAWLGRIAPLYWGLVTLLAAGFWGNAIGAPAYALGMASGWMRHNIAASFLSLAVLLAGSLALGPGFGAMGVGVAGAAALALGGLFVKHRNEPLLMPDGRCAKGVE